MNTEKYEEANSNDEREYSETSLRSTFPRINMSFFEFLRMMRFLGPEWFSNMYRLAFFENTDEFEEEYNNAITPFCPTFTTVDGYVYCFPGGRKTSDELRD